MAKAFASCCGVNLVGDRRFSFSLKALLPGEPDWRESRAGGKAVLGGKPRCWESGAGEKLRWWDRERVPHG